MPKRILILIFIAAMALAACQGQARTSPTVSSPTIPAQTTVTQEAEIPTATADPINLSAAGVPPGCTVISPRPTPGPTEQSTFPPVTDKDWNTGSKEAAITLIEYGDFQ